MKYLSFLLGEEREKKKVESIYIAPTIMSDTVPSAFLNIVSFDNEEET